MVVFFVPGLMRNLVTNGTCQEWLLTLWVLQCSSQYYLTCGAFSWVQLFHFQIQTNASNPGYHGFPDMLNRLILTWVLMWVASLLKIECGFPADVSYSSKCHHVCIKNRIAKGYINCWIVLSSLFLSWETDEVNVYCICMSSESCWIYVGWYQKGIEQGCICSVRTSFRGAFVLRPLIPLLWPNQEFLIISHVRH